MQRAGLDMGAAPVDWFNQAQIRTWDRKPQKTVIALIPRWMAKLKRIFFQVVSTYIN